MTAIDDFIKEAQGVDLETIFTLVNGVIGKKRQDEYVGACPVCGGKDRFTINFAKGLWHCRQCDGGKGGDGLSLVAQMHGFNLSSRSGMLGACAEILGRAPPEGGETETEEEKAARQARIADRRAAADRRKAQSAATAERKRQFAIDQGRGFWFNASDAASTVVEDYLRRRTGAASIDPGVWENLKLAPKHGYFDGKDERGYDIEIHCGPAMIAPMIDLGGQVRGCHRTWIDLDRPPKLRPDLGVNADGDARPTKTMRGHKRGSLIPICGTLEARRWLVGEGIETVIAIAAAEGWRADTFYAAAGDIGNMCGPADPDSRFPHPTLKQADAKGRMRPVMIAGPVPRAGSEEDCFQLPPGVTELVLLADGDSEHWFTVAAMARAVARLGREGLTIVPCWPLVDDDFADMAVAASAERVLA